MPRYELAGDRFWEVTRTGATLTIVSGKLGNPGRTTTKAAADDEAAEALCEHLIEEMEKRGYQAVVPGAPKPAKPASKAEQRNPELKAAIAKDPEDPAAYSVYADWLQGVGELRGELIAAQIAADARDSAKAKAAADELLERHAWYFLGPLAHDPALALSWHNGFLHRAELVEHHAAQGTRGRSLEALLAHPSARFLVALAANIDRTDAAGMLDVLARMAPPSLRQLELFSRCELPDLGAVWQRCHSLHQFELAAHSFGCGRIVLPHVRRARFLCTALGGRSTRQIAGASWPELERLDIYFGEGSATFDDVKPLLARSDLPKLTHLKLRGASFVGQICRALPASPLAKQLVALDLSKGELADADDLAVLAAHRFERLKELALPVTLAYARTIAPVEKLAKTVTGDEKIGGDHTINQLMYEEADDEYFEGVQE